MSTPDTLTLSPLARTVADTPTDIWNDSCNVDELAYAVAFGAVGATANPTLAPGSRSGLELPNGTSIRVRSRKAIRRPRP